PPGFARADIAIRPINSAVYRLWTGTRLIELCQRGVRNKDSLREMLRAAA
ncbi:hypothetical protein GOB39_28490, partial [Sinorhizobium meliloti]|nr:hypothetical protein [Sinorhizobium meliloti]